MLAHVAVMGVAVSRRVVGVAVFGGARDGPVHQRLFRGAVPCAPETGEMVVASASTATHTQK